MRRSLLKIAIGLMVFWLTSCKKGGEGSIDPPPVAQTLSLMELKVDDLFAGFVYRGVKLVPEIKIALSSSIDKSTVNASITWRNKEGSVVDYEVNYDDGDKTLYLKPKSSLSSLTDYTFVVTNKMKSTQGASLASPITVNLITAVDSTDKFERISDEELLSRVQQQTFNYFWDFAHPTSGMARERSTSGDVVTTGGSGFGIMAIVVAVERGFITRQEGHDRLRKIVDFLQTAERFHGAFPHWLNGNTGKTHPFSTKDDGADLVETSLLMQGLLTAREYFDDGNEQPLYDDITALYEAVDWDFFRNSSQKLYWHWSPAHQWEMNLPISGWNESLITYVLAASSPTHAIEKMIYDEGWARNGAMKNGNTYYGIPLPLGPERGGPLFFAHYSFLGINPFGLSDAYTNYEMQVKAHTNINRAHCITNPGSFYGYSADCWGLTASDDIGGYMAHSPTNDNGVISPTAALSSFPYTPEESMKALHFMYYKLGDKLWGEYGFKDAFSLHHTWFADSYLAIDQGPIIIMIENYRTGLLWNLFMSAPEVKNGLQKLGFNSPQL